MLPNAGLPWSSLNIWQWQTHMYLVQSKQSDVGNESSSSISAICWNMGWGRPASCQIFSILICQPGDKILWKTYWLFKWKINYLDYSNWIKFLRVYFEFPPPIRLLLAILCTLHINICTLFVNQYPPIWPYLDMEQSGCCEDRPVTGLHPLHEAETEERRMEAVSEISGMTSSRNTRHGQWPWVTGSSPCLGPFPNGSFQGRVQELYGVLSWHAAWLQECKTIKYEAALVSSLFFKHSLNKSPALPTAANKYFH